MTRTQAGNSKAKEKHQTKNFSSDSGKFPPEFRVTLLMGRIRKGQPSAEAGDSLSDSGVIVRPYFSIQSETNDT